MAMCGVKRRKEIRERVSQAGFYLLIYSAFVKFGISLIKL
jgi:hypothetical protein